MSRIRQLFFQLTTLCLLLFAIYQAWYSQAELRKRPDAENKRASGIAEITSNYEEHVFVLQSKFFIGIIYFLEQQSASPHGAAMRQSIEEVKRSFSQLLKPEAPIGGLGASAKNTPALLRYQIVLSGYLALEKEKSTACAVLERLTGDDAEALVRELNALVLRQCPEHNSGRKNSNAGSVYTEQEQAAIRANMGWIGKLLLLLADPEANPTHDAFKLEILNEARNTMIHGLCIALLVTFLGALSFACFVYMFSSLSRGNLQLRFRNQGMPSAYSLEIFCVYIAAMLAIPRLLEALSLNGSPHRLLVANVAGILCMLLLVSWPLLWRNKWSETRTRLGLFFTNVKSFWQDLLLGPFAYFSSIAVIAVAAIVYSLLLVYVGIDPAQGTHPVVPILTSSKDNEIVWLIGVLAVIAAPVVEEVMFRGALYSWLRERLGPFASMFACSAAFAAIHPQGVVGLVPLGCIGFVLAFLREWRGTILPCIIAHACFNAGTLAMVISLFRK